MDNQPSLSVNARAARLVDQMLADAPMLGIRSQRGTLGQLLIDAGVNAPGSIEAGLRLAEVCMGGLGRVMLLPQGGASRWKWAIAVASSNPVIACLASQYAGWHLQEGEGPGSYSVLGSGPGRAIARKEDLFQELAYRDDAGRAIFVLEAEKAPPDALVERIAHDCGLAPKDLVFLYAPTKSRAGIVQVVARVLEVALHKVHTLKFPVERVLDGFGSAPLPPPGGDFATAMGRTNDAIIFGGHVHLFVKSSEQDAEALANDLPSVGSRDYGRSFKEVFAAVNYDFYAIDPALFSPAAVTVTELDSGRSFHGGRINEALIDASFS
jgi:methenyltetrahydromethanopterin cyclohydrolase